MQHLIDALARGQRLKSTYAKSHHRPSAMPAVHQPFCETVTPERQRAPVEPAHPLPFSLWGMPDPLLAAGLGERKALPPKARFLPDSPDAGSELCSSRRADIADRPI